MAFSCLQGYPRSLWTAEAEMPVIILMFLVVLMFYTALPFYRHFVVAADLELNL